MIIVFLKEVIKQKTLIYLNTMKVQRRKEGGVLRKVEGEARTQK